MRVKEITEAVMSVGVQSKYPISAGARGLMGARFRYDKSVEENQKQTWLFCSWRISTLLALAPFRKLTFKKEKKKEKV